VGELGTYCGLAGDHLDATDAVGCGVATHRVKSAAFPDLVAALCSAVPTEALLGAFAEPVGEGRVMGYRPTIDRLFRADRIEDILAELDAAAAGAGTDAPFARSAAAMIRAKSPLSLKVTLAQLRRGATLDFDECMRTEFRVVSRVVRGHDFYEGIRSVIIDKDQAPRWQPSSLQAVSAADVERHFAPIAAELDLT
jgi:enoyl-CoA hydratase